MTRPKDYSLIGAWAELWELFAYVLELHVGKVTLPPQLAIP